ncbi:MAG: LptA/OstA family protein [Arcobacteraceae bacterium]
MTGNSNSKYKPDDGDNNHDFYQRKSADKTNIFCSSFHKIKWENNEQTPKKYTATGNVDFTVLSNEKVYLGKGDMVVYEPQESRYTIIGNGYLEEKIDGRILYGEKIYLDEITGKAKVVGDDSKPVRFMMKLQEKKQE